MKSIGILKEKKSLVLMIIWFLNDGFLKTEFPGFITGKISDLIGVYLTPFIFAFFLGALFPKSKEKVLFLHSILFTFFLFSMVNISQNDNRFVYSILTFGSKHHGTADPTDLICLGMLLVSHLRFESFRVIQAKKYPVLVVIFSSFVLFHTSAPPKGRSDISSILFLTNSGYDTIYLESPNSQSTLTNDSEFKFRFVSKENDSSPPSLSKLEIPIDCKSVNEVPKEGKFKNFSGMFFKDYLIVVSPDLSFNSIIAQTNCSQFTCMFDLSKLQTGTYHWKVLLQYVFIEKCERYLYKYEPKQNPLSFTK